MNYKKYAKNMLDCLYADGDVDVVFFSQLLGAVSYDANDKPLNKTKLQRLNDALFLANFLISRNDFSAGEIIIPTEGLSYFKEYPEKQASLQDAAQNIFKNEDDIDNIELTIKIVFKKNIINAIPPHNLPEEILCLFK